MTYLGFEITGYQLAFRGVAGITLGSAAMVVLMPNILRAALFLGLTLFGVAGFFVLMNAPFLAAVQVMIYVGAITTMIILAIFLSHRVMKVGFLRRFITHCWRRGGGSDIFVSVHHCCELDLDK